MKVVTATPYPHLSKKTIDKLIHNMYDLCMSSQAFNITLPKKLVTKIDKIAKENYMTRSDFLRYAAVKEIKFQEQDGWNTIVDFTKIDKNGVKAEDVLKALKSMKEQKPAS